MLVARIGMSPSSPFKVNRKGHAMGLSPVLLTSLYLIRLWCVLSVHANERSNAAHCAPDVAVRESSVEPQTLVTINGYTVYVLLAGEVNSCCSVALMNTALDTFHVM